MILVRINQAQRQRPEFWTGLSRRVLTFMHSTPVHAGELLEIELRLFEDKPSLLFGGVVVSCEKRRLDNRDLFRVNLLMDRITDPVTHELDRSIAAHANLAPPPAASPQPVAGVTSTAPRPSPSAQVPGRSAVDALVAERARMAEVQRELASLKDYAQSLENQLLDIRLAPAGAGHLASEHTPAYGTPAIDPSALRALEAEREIHAATLRQLDETRARLQMIEAGAVGTHQALTQQVETLGHRASAAEAELSQARSQAESARTEAAARLKAAEAALAAAQEATAAAQREGTERQRALEAKLAAAGDTGASANREAGERQRAAEEKLAAATEATAAAQREASERQGQLEAKLAAATEATAAAQREAVERQRAAEEKLANTAEATAAAQRETVERQRAAEEKLTAATEATASAQREASERLRALEEKLAAANEAVASAQRETTDRQRALDEKLAAAAEQGAAAQREAGERQRAAEEKLAAATEATAAAQREAGERQRATEEKLAAANEATAAAQREIREHDAALEARLALAAEEAAVASAAAAEKHKQLELQLAAATEALLTAERETVQMQKRATDLEGDVIRLKESAVEVETTLSSAISDADMKLTIAESAGQAARDKTQAVELQLSVTESAAAVAAEEAAAQKLAFEGQLSEARRAIEVERVNVAAEAARAKAGQAAFTVQEDRVRKLDEDQLELVRRIATLEGDQATQRKIGEEEVKAVRASALAAKEAAEARQQTLEQELAALSARVTGAPQAVPAPPAPAAVAPREETDARLREADARIAELTRERDFLEGKKTELERDLAAKQRAPAAAPPFAIQTVDDDEPAQTSGAVRWLVSFLVCGGLATAVVMWMSRAH